MTKPCTHAGRAAAQHNFGPARIWTALRAFVIKARSVPALLRKTIDQSVSLTMVEVVAPIVALTAFGTETVSKLYKFGANVSAAREQTARIGDRISDYMTILDVLEGVINQDPSFISIKAEEMIDRLCDQSYDLFEEIRALLPRGRDKLTLKDKVAWNFRKAKVELLLGQIEYIKSNVLLLVMTTLLGKKIRSRRYVFRSPSGSVAHNLY